VKFVDHGFDLIELVLFCGHGDLGQVGTGRKRSRHAAGLVANDHTDAVGVHVVQGLAHEGDEFAV
jgi:hypothetical protein